MLGGIWSIAYWVLQEAMSIWDEICAMSAPSVHMAALLQLVYPLYGKHDIRWLHGIEFLPRGLRWHTHVVNVFAVGWGA